MAMFRSRFAYQLAILTLLFVTAEAQASSKPSEAELAAITVRGVLLTEYDTAAWQATDAVQAAHPVEGRVGRYIARKTDAGWVVAFGRGETVSGTLFFSISEAGRTVRSPGCQRRWRSLDWKIPSATPGAPKRVPDTVLPDTVLPRLGLEQRYQPATRRWI